MLIEGPAPDPKCNLNISSFLTLPYPLDCLIRAKDIMIIVLVLVHMIGEWEGWGWFIYVRLRWGEGGGGQEVGIIVFLFLVLFCAVVNFSVMAGKW